MEKLADIRFFDTLTTAQNMRFVMNDKVPDELINQMMGHRQRPIRPSMGHPKDDGYVREVDCWPNSIPYSSAVAQILKVVKAVKSGQMSLEEGCQLLNKAGLNNTVLLKAMGK